MRKFLFLDGDGVINSVADNDLECEVCERNALLVKQIVDATDCIIILSSAWRLNPNQWLRTARDLAKYGIEVYDKTPNLYSGTRADEILEWLSAYNSVPYTFAVLDDENVKFSDKKEHLVKTDFEYGIQPEHVKKAITILNTKE